MAFFLYCSPGLHFLQAVRLMAIFREVLSPLFCWTFSQSAQHHTSSCSGKIQDLEKLGKKPFTTQQNNPCDSFSFPTGCFLVQYFWARQFSRRSKQKFVKVPHNLFLFTLLSTQPTLVRHKLRFNSTIKN